MDTAAPCQVLNMLKDSGSGPKGGFLLVDLRRNDHDHDVIVDACNMGQGGTIRGSINLPAQSLYHSIPTLYSSSRGRGNRAAGWFADYIVDQDDSEMRSVILQGGINGWVAAGEEYIQWMDGYDATKWSQG
ncbi:hypothetical protein DL764_001128 [Monosporascus ibericus]|uniref:Rhodanese domain-containing protein n=1 Tax=Monosporascus ibericus TaxID=155417 RepID=A0A4Q4TSF8_9PEZI|nr:hypothetical protein DL764_001128 [Monosporascus ibericus]